MSRIRVMATADDPLRNSHDNLPVIRIKARETTPTSGGKLELQLTKEDHAHLNSLRIRLKARTLAEAALIYMRTAWCDKAWNRLKKALKVKPRRRIRRRR